MTTPVGTNDISAADRYTYTTASIELSKATVTVIGAHTYTGAAVKPALRVTCQGVKLASGVDYTAAYTRNTKVGRASVTITGIGACSGTKSASFIVLPARTVLLKVASGSQRATLTWKRNAGGVSGYQVVDRRRGQSGFLNAGCTSGLSKTVRRLGQGKSYSFKVRAYKLVRGARYYGAWSRTLSVSVT